jgi:hypothetical protein
MQNDILNTVPIQQFIKQVKSAEASRANEVKLDINSAKNLAFTLGIVMTRLSEDLEVLLKKEQSGDNETIEVQLDGGNKW